MQENLDAEKFNVKLEYGWLKLHSVEAGGIVRVLPCHKVEVIGFADVKEETPRIVRPNLVPPANFDPKGN